MATKRKQGAALPKKSQQQQQQQQVKKQGAGAGGPTTLVAESKLSDRVGYSLSFEGLPLTHVCVTVDTKRLLRKGYDSEMVSVEVVDDQELEIHFDCSERFAEHLVAKQGKMSDGKDDGNVVTVRVSFPLAVDASRAAVQVLHGGEGKKEEEGALAIRLPFKPFSALVEEMKRAAPHKFGALNLSDSSFLDLE